MTRVMRSIPCMTMVRKHAKGDTARFLFFKGKGSTKLGNRATKYQTGIDSNTLSGEGQRKLGDNLYWMSQGKSTSKSRKNRVG